MPRPARPWVVAILVSVAAAAVVVPLAATLQAPVAGDPLAEELGERSRGEITVARREQAVRFVGTEPGRPIDLGVDDPGAAADAFVDRYGDDLAAAAIDLVPIATEERLDGGRAVRYQQEVDGTPVFGSQVSVQTDAGGGVLSSLADVSARAATAPAEATITPDAARRTAVAAVARETGAPAAALSATEPAPQVYDPAVVGAVDTFGVRRTWFVEVTADSPPVRHFVLVDATTGGVALSFSQLAHGLNRKVCDFANVADADETCTSFARTEGGPVHAVADVNRAYDFTGDTYDFYSSHFGRDGLADDGAPIVSAVRYCETSGPANCPYANAFWNGSQATYGQGFATDDVVAHELTHGVTEFTANLYYWYQSGAINESMSDVFGELVDLANASGGTDDDVADRWIIGEDLGGGALRNMADPPAAGDPDSTTHAAYVPGPADGGGVHSNSGVNNKAAVLMTDGGTFGGYTVTALGEEKVATVYYEALTAMLTSASDFQDLHAALPQACANLVPTTDLTAADCLEVRDAVDAVGMNTVPPAAPATDPPVCAEGQPVGDLFFDDAEATLDGRWGFDQSAGTFRWAYGEESDVFYATSGRQGFWGPDLGTTSQRSIVQSTAVALPPNSRPVLHFRHAYGFDSDAQGHWDGGVVEYSTTGPAGPWIDLGPRFEENGYPEGATLVAGSPNPLQGRPAFVDESKGYLSSRADLSSLAGQSVRLRFRIGEDSVLGDRGWFVDDIRIADCPDPDLDVSLSADQTAVVAGQDIDLHVGLQNTGNVTLTGIETAHSAATSCDQPVADLVPGASTIVDCTYTTVDPDDVGTWADVVTVTAVELDDGVSSTPATVDVAAPSPTAEVTLEAEQSQVTAGDDIDLELTVANTGNVALTGVVATTDPPLAACEEPVPDLAPEASHVVDCSYTTVDPDDVGPWEATATVTADQLGEPVESTPASVNVLAPATAAATVTATAMPETVVAGEGIDLGVTVRNTGNVVLTDVAVAHSTATTCDGAVPDLAPEAEHSVACTHPTVDPDDVGLWTDTATVTAAELDPAGVSAAPVEVTVEAPDPSVDVQATADQEVVDAGDAVDVHVSIENTGNVALTGLAVTAADEASCVGPLADLAPDATVVVDCTHPTAATDQGPWSFTATVDADQLDPVTTEAVEVLVLRAALEVEAAAQETTVEVGDPVHVDLTVTNVGNVDLTGVTLTEPLCDTPPAAVALAAQASVELDCTVTTDASAVPPFAVVGAWTATPTVDSDQSPAASAGPLSVVATIPPHGFTDPAAWVDDALSWISFHGIAGGYPNGQFRHGWAVTRGQVVAWLHTLAGSPAPSGCTPVTFSDVGAGNLAVAWAACDPPGDAEDQQPIITGYKDGTFRASLPITRAQVARMVWRFAGVPAPAGGSGCGLAGFSDVPPWVRPAVDWAACDPDGVGAEEPMLTGYKDGTFRPDRDISRGQVARFLYRLAGRLDL